MNGREPRCTGTKTCSICKQPLPALCYSAERQHADGLASACRSCEREARARRRREQVPKKKRLVYAPLDREPWGNDGYT